MQRMCSLYLSRNIFYAARAPCSEFNKQGKAPELKLMLS